MPNDYTAPNDHIRDYRHYIEHEKPEKFLDGARLALKKLHQALQIIPKNLAHPEWIRDLDVLPQLYRQKDEAQQDAEGEARTVQHYITVLNREINRCGNNLNALQRDLQILRSQGTQITYQESINQYAAQFRKASKQRKLAIEVLTALKAAIRESAARQFDAEYELATSKGRVPDAKTPEPQPRRVDTTPNTKDVYADVYTQVLQDPNLYVSKERNHGGVRHPTQSNPPETRASHRRSRGGIGDHGIK